jgi:hypothetical protein
LSQKWVETSIGTAPDGLPWWLTIHRGATGSDLLHALRARLGYSSEPDYRGTEFARIVDQADELIRRRDIVSINTGTREVECYVTGQPIGRLMGQTLLASLFGLFRGVSGKTSPDTRVFTQTFAANAAPPAAPAPPAAEPPRIPVRAEVGLATLALPRDGSQPLVVSRRDSPGDRTVRFLRLFESESLAAFRTARFTLHSHRYRDGWKGSMSDLTAYSAARTACVEDNGTILCEVDVAEIAAKAPEIALSLQKLHDSGLVHGDVKPENILLTRSGAQVIDSLDIPAGDRSPAMTQGWASPEQVIGLPVQFATDQHAIGLLLCKLLNGVLFGEQVTYLIPVGGSNLERFTMLRNPGVYLAPEAGRVQAEGLGAWQIFLDRCLRFQPEDRFPSMSELAGALRELLAKHPVEGTLSFTTSFGTLEDRGGQWTWRLQDIRS